MVAAGRRRDASELGPGWKWTSDGSGSYEIEAQNELPRGTRIELKLKQTTRSFADKAVVEGA